jgi:murein DD-endopeptidase MepM/ murein hydrolase activator NlpD
MHDYKFRHSDLSSNKPKRTLRKATLGIFALLIAAALVYGIAQLDLPWETQTKASGTSSEIIPLELPPRSDFEKSAPPADDDPSPQAGDPYERTFAKAMNLLQEKGPTTSLAAENGDQAGKPARPDQPEEQTAKTGAGGVSQSADERHTRKSKNGTWIKHVVRPGESLAKIFRDNDLSPQLLRRILHSGKEAKHLSTIRPEDELRIRLDPNRQFAELHIQLDPLRSVQFAATESGIRGTKVVKNTETMAAAASGIIDHTLFTSASKAGLPDTIIMKMIKIFRWDIDFALEIRPGDSFAVIYEELWADGEQVGSGDVIAAEFVNNGNAHQAIRYTNLQGKTDYYSPDGTPLKKSFFRTPVQFTRISSGFSSRRWHPVLKRTRAHKGVDYAAPSGTPIVATGDATVELRGWKGGYGRVVYLKHDRKYRTVYGHMSRFAKGLRVGDRVKQGQVIGYVGQSGLATGPHLHYELQVDGVHRNPLGVLTKGADPLPAKEMAKFHQYAKPILASLEQTSSETLLAEAH